VFLGLTLLDLSAMDATVKGNDDWDALRGSAFVKSVVADSLGGVAVVAGATAAGLFVVRALTSDDADEAGTGPADKPPPHGQTPTSSAVQPAAGAR
jgi:hypothetical protein